MAGDWIKMRSNLWDDPRVTRICDLTQNFEASVIGGLFWLWSTADQHTENGILIGMSSSTINRKTGISGFAEALIDIGWIAESSNGIRIVRFDEHNGASAKNRAQTAKRVAAHAVKKKAEKSALAKSKITNEASVSGALPRGGVSSALPREREREEKNLKSTPPSQSSEMVTTEYIRGAVDPETGEISDDDPFPNVTALAGRVSA